MNLALKGGGCAILKEGKGGQGGCRPRVGSGLTPSLIQPWPCCLVTRPVGGGGRGPSASASPSQVLSHSTPHLSSVVVGSLGKPCPPPNLPPAFLMGFPEPKDGVLTSPACHPDGTVG